MARDKKLLQRRNGKIIEAYERLRSARIGRQRKYTAAYVISKLADDFDLAERTIEDIVWKAR